MRNGGKSMAEKCVRVRVPGTSANCGPGFDCLGLACTVYNDLELRLTREPGLSITMTGEGATNIPCDNRNIVWRSAQYLLEKAGKDKEYRGAVIHMENRVPLSRGLGSSATAIVAGLTAANALIGNPFNRREILQFATNIEGHPDNVAPAIFGGFTVNAVTNGRVDCFSFLPRFRMKFVVAVPNFPLSTRMARKVLPTEVPMKDANEAFQWFKTPGLVQGKVLLTARSSSRACTMSSRPRAERALPARRSAVPARASSPTCWSAAMRRKLSARPCSRHSASMTSMRAS